MPCPACGSGEAGEAVPIPDHEYGLPVLARYAACGRCGTLFQDPMPDVERLAGFYPPEYHSVAPQPLLARLRHAARWRSIAPRLDGPGAVLDFGCGDGGFVRYVAGRDPTRDVWGFELGSEGRAEHATDGRVHIVHGRPEDLFERLPSCRLVTLNHVVEHLPDPGAILRALGTHLAEGGWIVGQTPAADSLEHEVFGRSWSGFHAPRHTVVFSRDGLGALLGECGLEAVRVRPAFNPAAIAVSVGAALHRGRAGRIRRGGAGWLALLGVATLLAPAEILSGRPGIVDFEARVRRSAP